MKSIIILTIASDNLAFSSAEKMEQYLMKNDSELGLSESDIRAFLAEKIFDNSVADFAYDVVTIDAEV